MTVCSCGRAIPQQITHFGPVQKVVQPTVCGACLAERSGDFESLQAEAMSRARAEGAGLPHAADAYPDFLPIVEQARSAITAEKLCWVSGEPGDGKTTLAIIVGEWALSIGWSVRYEHGSVFGDKAEWERQPLWLAVDLLIVDNLMSGRSKMPDFLLDRVDALIERRSTRGAKTLVTSERPLAWLCSGDNAMADERFQKRALDLCGDTGDITLPYRGGR